LATVVNTVINSVLRGADQQEHRRSARHAPDRGPHRLTRAVEAMCAEVLCHQRLHRGAGAAQHQYHCQDEPLHRAHRGQCRGGDAPDEPHVGEIEHDLHGTVGHEWQRQREHRALIDVRVSGRIDALRRQPPRRRRTLCAR
jgi:hypothetical protein